MSNCPNISSRPKSGPNQSPRTFKANPGISHDISIPTPTSPSPRTLAKSNPSINRSTSSNSLISTHNINPTNSNSNPGQRNLAKSTSELSNTTNKTNPTPPDSPNKEILQTQNKRISNDKRTPRDDQRISGDNKRSARSQSPRPKSGEIKNPNANSKRQSGDIKHHRMTKRNSKDLDRITGNDPNNIGNHKNAGALRPTFSRKNQVQSRPTAHDLRTCLNYWEPKTFEFFRPLLFKRCIDTFVDLDDHPLIQLRLVNKYYNQQICNFILQLINDQSDTTPPFFILDLSEDKISWLETSFRKSIMLYFHALHNLQDKPSTFYRNNFNLCIQNFFLNANNLQIFIYSSKVKTNLTPQEYCCQLMPLILENLESNQLEFRVFGLSILLKLPLIPSVSIESYQLDRLPSLLIQIINKNQSKPRSNALEVKEEILALNVWKEKFLNKRITISKDLLDQLIPLLINRVKDDQYVIRFAALTLLDQFLYHETIFPKHTLNQLMPLAIEAVNEKNRDIRLASLSIVSSLIKLGFHIPHIYINNFVPLLVNVFQGNEYWESRVHALDLLSIFIDTLEGPVTIEIVTDEILDTLIPLATQALTDDHWKLRARAFVFLGTLQERGLFTDTFDFTETISLTINILQNDIHQVRSPALWFFSRLLKYDIKIFLDDFKIVSGCAIAAITDHSWQLKMAAFNLFTIVVAKDFLSSKDHEDFFEVLINLSIEETKNTTWSVRASALWLLKLILTRDIPISEILKKKINIVAEGDIGKDEDSIPWHPERFSVMGKGMPIPKEHLDIPLENKFLFLSSEFS